MTDQSLWTPPEIEIAGEEYELRRLGMKDLRGLWSIIKNVVGQLDLSIFEDEEEEDEEESDEEKGKELIVQVLEIGPDAYDRMVEWLVDIVDGLEKEDINDPSVFPVHAPFTILEALSEHEDFEKFFTKGRKAMQTLGKMNPVSQSSSTTSQSDTDGKTNT